MWCRNCAQDVPGIPSIDAGEFSCARCGRPLTPISPRATGATSYSARRAAGSAGGVSSAAESPPRYDGWDIDEQLRHFGRVLGPPVPADEPCEPAGRSKYRLDAAHDLPAAHATRGRHSRKKARPRHSKAERHAPGDGFLAFLAWMTLSLGAMGLACGLSLMGWSMHTGRQELWTIGMPISLAGQIAIVLGLVLQVDRVWRDHRHAAAKMDTVDEQLRDLKTATSILGTTYGPSSAFYAHWSGGAGAEVLLGDLKSQLDLLAVKLAKQ
jgi:hypothetical protein